MSAKSKSVGKSVRVGRLALRVPPHGGLPEIDVACTVAAKGPKGRPTKIGVVCVGETKGAINYKKLGGGSLRRRKVPVDREYLRSASVGRRKSVKHRKEHKERKSVKHRKEHKERKSVKHRKERKSVKKSAGRW